MPSRTIYMFLCLVLAFTTVTVFRAPAETIDEYKERIKKEQEEQKKKKNRNHDEKGGAPDLSGLCGCLGSLFEAMASTDIEVTVEQEAEPEYVNPPPADETPPDDATVTPDDSLPPNDTPPDDATVTPDDSLPPDDTPPDDATVSPDDSLPPDAAADGTATDTQGDDTVSTDDANGAPEDTAQPGPAEEPDRVKPIKPFIALSLAGSYLFGQDIPFFDGFTRLTMNIDFFHIHAWYQLMADANGSYLSTFSTNLGVVLDFDTVVSSLYAGILAQEGSNPAFSFGSDLKFAISDNFFLELYALLSFSAPFFNIIFVPSLNLVVGPLTVGAGFNLYDYSGLVVFGPSVSLGLWF